MKIAKNKYDIFTTLLSLLCLIGAAVYLIISWDKIPAEIPGHYNAAGEVDKISNKNSLIINLALGWILFIGISVIEKFPQVWNTGIQITEQNKEKVYSILKNMIGTMKLLVALVFSYLTVQTTTGGNLPLLFLPVFLILMFGTIAFFIYKLVRV